MFVSKCAHHEILTVIESCQPPSKMIRRHPSRCFNENQSRGGVMDHWTTRQVSTNWFGLEHVVYGNGRYVAYGTYSDYGALMSSEDGINWALRLDGKAPSANGFSFAASMHFAH